MVSVSGSFPISIIIFLACFGFSYEISCKDENNKDVDWYVNYKLPTIEKEPDGSDLREGAAYAYMTAPGTGSWKLSKKSIDEGSMLENTLENLYSNEKKLSYLFYNDDPPPGFKGTSVGHLKGVVAFDAKTGYWLVHSIPNFPDDRSFKYPKNAYLTGQSILCVTFKTSQLNKICNQLLYSSPNIYSYAITDEVEKKLDDSAASLFTEHPSFVKKGSLTKTTTLKSKGGKEFVSFAKDNQYKYELYSEIIAPHLKSSLLVETWKRGSYIPPSCNSDFVVEDVVSVNMSITSGKKTKNIVFKSTEDHSKWAIAQDGKHWVCIADLNRMRSQENRGGGALCFVSAPVNKAFESIVSEAKECPR